jgi:branched-chain amino acid transport system ATP-binding protein
MTEVALRCEGAVMRFGGLTALDHVSFTLGRGQVLGVIGPNGAGKSTLFNLLTGIYRPQAGAITFLGHDLTRAAPHQIVRLGIGRTFQTSRLFQDLSVLDNVVIGMHTRTSGGVLGAIFKHGRARRQLEQAAERAGALLQSVSPGLYEDRLRPARQLPQADRRRLEIARALAAQPKLLLLDEPSSGMDEDETAQLVADVRRIRAERPELSMIVIEHDMALVMELPERVIVLDYGRKIAEGRFDEVRRMKAVQEAYLGRALDA